MSVTVPVTAAADTRRSMPTSMVARFDTANAAVNSLREEQRRLHRLGFEIPQARCHQQLRYWSFVRALHALGGEECA
ncbi:MAG: hypothetical protein ABIU54_00330 [Candidatus Eisenbacteria bacterium]